MLTLPEKLLFGVIVASAIVWFVYRGVSLVRFLLASRVEPENRFDHLPQRAWLAAWDVISQRRVLRRPIVGAFHLLIVWGFFVFAVNTINHFMGAFLPGFHLFGNTLLAAWYASLADIFAVLIILGVLGLAFRRHVLRPVVLTRPSPESVLVFSFIGGAMVAYLCSHATRIATVGLPHADYYLVSNALAQGLAPLSPGVLNALAHVAWWCDALMHLTLVALLIIPTKHMHLVAGPFNLLLAKKRPRGAMSLMDLEAEDATFGVARISDYSWKENLDLYACIECGRCLEYCPTYTSGKPLKPKDLIVTLKDHLLEQGPAMVNAKGKGPEAIEAIPALAGGVVDTEAIWACTTCAACVEHCPMGIEHIDKLTGLRRNLVLMEANFPSQADTAFRNMETAGNPWGLPPSDRASWAQGLDVPLMADKGSAEVLFWVGCAGSYDDRSRKISVALVKLLKAAGVDFAILGEEERCTCESARRLGNEYLYQAASQEILEVLGRYTFKRILVTCPHCYNTFVNDYPALGGNFEVVHHTELLDELIRAGQLTFASGTHTALEVVFHDSCYLGRYNHVFDAPRAILSAAGCAMREPARTREHGFCCGAGGGRMWLEEKIGDPINTLRVRELAENGAQEIASACPFCMTMLSDALKREPAISLRVRDVAEVLADRLENKT